MQTISSQSRLYCLSKATFRRNELTSVRIGHNVVHQSKVIIDKRTNNLSIVCQSQPSTVSSSGTASASAAPPALPALDGTYEDVCSFTDYANWLLPGKLLLGRYPYVEPSRCRSRDQGEKQLDEILQTGVSVFVCLQAELPPQKDMKVGGVDGFLPYKPTAQMIAAAKSDPPSIEECNQLRTPELDRFLPPRRRQQTSTPRKRFDLDLEFAHSPIVDLGLPEEGQLQQLVADLKARLTAGQAVYLHCWGGRGRAGTVGACLLADMYGLNADEALERVQRSFDTRQDGGRKSPETEEQIEFVKRFIAANK